MNPNYGY